MCASANIIFTILLHAGKITGSAVMCGLIFFVTVLAMARTLLKYSVGFSHKCGRFV
jgi:hypothetical protein